MKLIDKSALLAEIKKLHGNPFYRMAIKDVLSILDTMQEEPVSEDLEEASKNYALNNTPWDDCKDEIQESFKAGAKWQKQKDSIVSEELIDVAKQYVKEHVIGIDKITFRIATDMFISGAKWQKEQMMSKAIDGDVTFDYYGNDNKTYGCIAHDFFCLEDFGLKDRDKVRMILIKED